VDFVAAFKVAEAVWWFLVAVVVAAKWRRHALAAAFLIFGASDLIELRTGAWWRPWWLAGLKVACVVAIVALSLAWFRRARRPGP